MKRIIVAIVCVLVASDAQTQEVKIDNSPQTTYERVRPLEIREPSKPAVVIPSASLKIPSSGMRDRIYHNLVFDILPGIPTPPIIYRKEPIAEGREVTSAREAKARELILKHAQHPGTLNSKEVIDSYSDAFLFDLAADVLKNKDRYLLTAKNYSWLASGERAKEAKYQPINDVMLLVWGIKHRDSKVRVTELTEPLVDDAEVGNDIPWVALQSICFCAIEADDKNNIPTLWKRLKRAIRDSRAAENSDVRLLYWSRIATRYCCEAIVRLSDDHALLDEFVNWAEATQSGPYAWTRDDPVIINTLTIAKEKKLKLTLKLSTIRP